MSDDWVRVANWNIAPTWATGYAKYRCTHENWYYWVNDKQYQFIGKLTQEIKVLRFGVKTDTGQSHAKDKFEILETRPKGLIIPKKYLPKVDEFTALSIMKIGIMNIEQSLKIHDFDDNIKQKFNDLVDEHTKLVQTSTKYYD